MFKRLDEVSDEGTRQEILTSCACHYPRADLDDARGVFLETGDVDQVIDLLQAKFEEFLRESLELDEEIVCEIIERGWGLAGTREGNRIIATKIPKSGYLKDYFQAEDPLEKRKFYCHCPRVRDVMGEDPQLPQTYCYCGAGFYQGIWEKVLDEPIKVEVLESVMTGGDMCQIAVILPETVAINLKEE
jgi:cyanophycinase-like exopeptidase